MPLTIEVHLMLPVSADFERLFRDGVWQEAAAAICARHRFSSSSLQRSQHGENIIFFVDDRRMLKIYAPARRQFQRERAALEAVAGQCSIPTPEVIAVGEIDGWPYLVMTRLRGARMTEVWPSMERTNRLEIVRSLGQALRDLRAGVAPLPDATVGRSWSDFVARQAAESVERQRRCGANPEWIAALPDFLAERLPLLDGTAEVFLHGDVHPGNVLLAEEDGRWRITALLDFADSLSGAPEYELVAPGVLMVQGDAELQRALFTACGYGDAQLDRSLRARLMLLTVLYECSDLRKYALRLRPDAIHLSLAGLERAIWSFVPE
jgi:hygromycin-B 7''-O-kinase